MTHAKPQDAQNQPEQDPETQDQETPTDTQNQAPQEPESQDRESQDSVSQEPAAQEPPVQESDEQEPAVLEETDTIEESKEAPQPFSSETQAPVENVPADTLTSDLPEVPETAQPDMPPLGESPGNTAPNIPQESPTAEQIAETAQEALTHVDFDLLDAEGRWLIKVLSGPNTGAEFSLQSGTNYLVGSDPSTCDIVFQDLSISRQHARLTIDTQDKAFIEDLGSKNGTLIDGEKVTTKRQAVGTSLVILGTTSFILVDKEGERKTLVTPAFTGQQQAIAPGSVGSGTLEAGNQMAGKEGAFPGQTAQLGAIQHAVYPPLQSEVGKIKEEEKKQAKAAHAVSSLVILAVLSGVILVIGVGTTLLFQTEQVAQPHSANAEAMITKALVDYPSVRYSFNPSNNHVLLVGHVLTAVDRSKLLDNLKQLKFIANIDSSNVIIDELVWRETNQVLSQNPAWKGITISSPAAGRFVVSGSLRTRDQAEELYDYLSQNFSYVDLLEKRVVVEEDLLAQVSKELNNAGFRGVTPSYSSGILTLRGAIGNTGQAKFDAALANIKAIPGVRGVQLNVASSPQQEAVVNITGKYAITGSSVKGNAITVVVNGRILSKGDAIDGMQITEITPHAVYLEKDDVKYKIDFNM